MKNFKRTGIRFIGLMVLALWVKSGSAWADPAQDDFAQLTQLNQEEAKVNTQIDAIKIEKKKNDKKIADLNREIEKNNRENAVIEGEVQQFNASNPSEGNPALEQRREANMKRGAELNDLQEGLRANDKARMGKAVEVVRHYKEIKAQQKAVLASLSQLKVFHGNIQDCLNLSPIEAVVQCMQSHWDGANANPGDNDTSVVDGRGKGDLTPLSLLDLEQKEINKRNSKKITAQAAADSKKLVANPEYTGAVDDGIVALKNSDKPAEQVAIDKAEKIESPIVLPTDKDMELLFPGPAQSVNGENIPMPSEEISKIYSDHPELKSRLADLWRKTCENKIADENVAMNEAVEKASKVVDTLGLPYGHIDETVAKDPKTGALYTNAIQKITDEEVQREILASNWRMSWFRDQVKELSKSVGPNP